MCLPKCGFLVARFETCQQLSRLYVIAFRDGKQVVVVYLDDGFRQPIVSPNAGPLRWSRDGRLLAIGGRIVGRTTLPAPNVSWAPTGERAAYVTRRGGVCADAATHASRRQAANRGVMDVAA